MKQKKFEYTIDLIGAKTQPQDLCNYLNEKGEQGFVLSSVIPTQISDKISLTSQPVLMFILYKEKSEIIIPDIKCNSTN